MKDLLLINKFISIFEDHIDFIITSKFPQYSELYKKIICFGIIDTLSRTVVDTKKPRKRVTEFINKFSKNKIWNKVSSSHLIKLLELESFFEFNELKIETSNILNRIQEKSLCIVDLNYADICNKWPKIRSIKHTINNRKIGIDDVKHINLFYNYRNYVVHELRRPDSNWDDDLNHDEPYYESVLDTRYIPYKNSWEIGYPLGFFVKICYELIHETKNFLNSHSINPFAKFDRTDFLIEEFNKKWF